MILKHGWKVPSYCSNYLKLGYDQFGGWLDQSNHLGHLDLFTAMQCIAQLLRLDCSHCTSVPGAKKCTSVPGAGNEGIEQSGTAGNISMLSMAAASS